MNKWIEKVAANLKRAHDLATDVVFIVQARDGREFEYRILFDPTTGEESICVRHGGIVDTKCIERSYPGATIRREWKPQ